MIFNTPNNKTKLLFIDRITILSLIKICLFGRNLETVWFFEPINKYMQRLISLARFLHIIQGNFHKNHFNVNQIRNELGVNQYCKIYSEIRNICSKIMGEHIENNPLLEKMESLWDRRKLNFYFEKAIERYASGELVAECFRVALVEWIIRYQYQCEPTVCVILIEKTKWHKHIRSYAESKEIQIYGYRYRKIRKVINYTKRFLKFIIKLVSFVCNILNHQKERLMHINKKEPLNDNIKRSKKSIQARIGICYSGAKIDFDPTERTEFFWLNDIQISGSDLILYNFFANDSLYADALNQLSLKQIKLMGNGDGIPAWVPTSMMIKTLIRVLLIIFTGNIKCILKGKWIAPYYTFELVSLGSDYSYWIDFFSTNNIVVNVSILNATTMGQVLALDTLNVLSVSYQHSASNYYPTTFVSSGENIQFLFSDFYERLFREVDAPVDYYIKTGFIYDSAFQAIKNQGSADIIRKELKTYGAEFILCFYDENSIDRWDMPVPHEEATKDYKCLLEWLLEDKTLGIVFKPKRSQSLYQRISQASELINKARATGRCIFLTSSTKIGGIYPAEAAMISDLCIGKFPGISATLEAQLIGVPSILIDTNNNYDHMFYTWGKDVVVFDNWKSLKNAINKYRTNPESNADIGNWSPFSNQLDPFLDGEASCRMGSYIQWAFQELKRGGTKRKAIETANRLFSEKWGSQYISENSPQRPKVSIT